MNNYLRALLFLFPVARYFVHVAANVDTEPISLDDIEGPKAARLMKNKEDIDVQSNYHEIDIKDTGDIGDDLSGRIVKNRGPITAKIVASGHHGRYCETGQEEDSCRADFSLIAWKFAGDSGSVHGTIEEKFQDDDLLKVDVDCMMRTGKHAIVGGVVKQIPKRFDDIVLNQRAYVKVVESSEGDNGIDFISNVAIGLKKGDVDSGCNSISDDEFQLGDEFNCMLPRVSVCSKHNGWDDCLERAKTE
ncbi:hypothetical protein ACHAW6_004405 [Cyclotella cf. meneghiniana]